MSAPDSPFHLADALVDAYAALRPSMATYIGVAGHDDRWEDLSPEGNARVEAELRAWRARAAALPAPDGRWARLAAHVTDDWLDQEISALAAGDPEVDLNTLASPLQNLRGAFDAMDTRAAGGWANVATRVEALPAALDGYRRTLDAGRARGRAVAARQVRGCAAQARVHAGPSSFFRGLPARAAADGVTDAALLVRLDAAVPAASAAYARFADWLESDYLPDATSHDGVGRARYLRAMRRFLGATPDPEETYAWGWTEVARLRARMAELAARIAPGRAVPAVTAALEHDPDLRAPDAPAFLAAVAERQARALAALDAAGLPVPAEVRAIAVREAPPGGTIGAYYVAPSEDLSRPGTVWYRFAHDATFALWREVSTAYHEGFPGHHLQLGIQVSLTHRLSRLHRLVYGYSGFSEGWALYAEELMRELGGYERPELELGMLANQMVRACRVVFDIGAHLGLPIPGGAPFHPGGRWSFELGVEMMVDLAGLTPTHAASEVTRYLGFPAQAISYKVGQRQILSLRDEFLASGGGLADFHARVLGGGNVGLDRLREQVLGG